MREITPKGERERRAQAAKWWLTLRAAEPTEKDLTTWLEWHGRDPRNAEAFEGARELAGRLHATDPKALSSLIAEFAAPRRRTRSIGFGWPLRLGITMIAIAAAAVGYRRILMRGGMGARLEYATPIAVNRDIALPDGSRIILGAESQLNASFSARARDVELKEGEAYFKVRHEERRPFYVRAGGLTIRDIGTAFDVLKTGQRVTVTVTQGRIQVTEAGTPSQGAYSSNTVDISAGQQVLYSPDAAGLRVARVDPAETLTWREQRLEFVGTPLSTVIANINRYVKRPLSITDPVIGQLSFTGTVDLHSLDRWLGALQTVFPVRVEHRPAGDAIVPRTSPAHR
ncbi:MAG: FecR family protein [Steroidobacteraceae bacterium]